MWRRCGDELQFDGPVYAGIMAPLSAAMARKLAAEIPQLAVPEFLIEALQSDRDAGVDFACGMVERIRQSHAFDGARGTRPGTAHPIGHSATRTPLIIATQNARVSAALPAKCWRSDGRLGSS